MNTWSRKILNRTCAGIIIGLSLILVSGNLAASDDQRLVLVPQDVQSPIDTVYIGAMKEDKVSITLLTDIAIRYVQNNELKQARQVLDVIKSLNKPQAHISSVIKVATAMVKHNKFDAAKALALSVKATKKDVVLERIILESLTSDQLDNAIKASRDIESDFVFSRVLHQIVESYANLGNIDAALALTKNIQYTDQRDLSYLAIGKSLVKDNALVRALDFSANISNETLRFELVNLIVDAYISHGSIDEAVMITYSISKESSKAEALKKIIEYYSIDSNYLLAYEYLEMIIDNIQQQEGIAEVVYGLIHNNEFEEADNLTKEIVDEGVKNKLYEKIALYLAEKGKFEKSVSYAEKITDTDIYNQTYKELGAVFGKERQFHFPLLLVRQISNEHARDLALKSFVSSFKYHASASKVLSVVDQISNSRLRFDTLKTLHRFYLNENKESDAILVIDKTRSLDEEILLVFNQVAFEISIDHKDRTQKSLDRLEELAQNVSTAQKLDTYLKLSDLYLMLEQEKKCEATLQKAARLVVGIDARKDTAYSNIAIKYSMLNKSTDAIVFVKKIKSDHQRLRCLLDFDMAAYPDRQSSKYLSDRVRSLYSSYAKSL